MMILFTLNSMIHILNTTGLFRMLYYIFLHCFRKVFSSISYLDYMVQATNANIGHLIAKRQRLKDSSVKHLQNLFSAVLRPLDILAHESATLKHASPNL